MDEQYQELLRCIESLDARERIQELGGDVLDRIKNRFVLGNPRVCMGHITKRIERGGRKR